MKIFDKTGIVAISSRLRMLSVKIASEADSIYSLYDIEYFNPKWFTTFYALTSVDQMSISEIAAYIGHSQPSATKIVKEMTTAKLCNIVQAKDKRKTVIALSEKGLEVSEKIKIHYKDVFAAIDDIANQAKNNLWEAIREWENLLDQQTLLDRIKTQRKIRETNNVTIVKYTDAYAKIFKKLNKEWISKYFEIEDHDLKILDNPKKYILDKGGEIFIALYNGKEVGVCALKKSENKHYDFELLKLAVSDCAKGKNIGFLLSDAVINEAQKRGGNSIFLESNTTLVPAINLYHKLGFATIDNAKPSHRRGNIIMALNLN